MSDLGDPQVPVPCAPSLSGSVVFTSGHHFQLPEGISVERVRGATRAPLSVILQVTKRCDFDCHFCSDTLRQPDPTLAQLETMRDNLAGVGRVILSGGEPLMRRDFGDVLDMFTGFTLAVATNATRALSHAPRLVDKIAYVTVGLDGPRAITARVRGDYDKIMTGVRVFHDHGLPLSLSCMPLRSTEHALPYTYQIADCLDAGKLTLTMPLPTGNALDLDRGEFLSREEATGTFQRLGACALAYGWRPALRRPPGPHGPKAT